ncbi:MAG: TonB-dependent receptor, partial [Prevotella sp.]|nr:TonB-dependent receptor [Prevotella sp.]
IDNLYASYSTYAYNTGNAAYDINGTNNNVVAGIVTAASGNKNLKWETTTQTNLGLDLGFFNNDLRLSFDYYWKNTKNMLTVPPTLSVQGENASVYMNTGNMKNTGFEVTIDYTSHEYSGFSWEGSFNIGHYKNKVEKLNSLVSQIGSDILLMEGQPMGVYYGYIADGIFQNEDEVNNHAIQQGKGVGRIRYRDLDGNGVIDENDRCVIGDPNPDLSLGLNLDFHYKNFTLSMFFTGEFGFDIYNSTKKQLDFMSYGGVSTNRGASILNAWSPTNTNSSIPAVSVSDDNDEMRMSTYFIEDGSYFKMKYIKLAYDLPRKICKSFCSTNVSFFAQVENVFTITGYSGLDPELPLGTYGARVDNGPYPAARTFSLGVNIGF